MFPCISLRVITKRDFGITVPRRPILHLTSFNNSKLMRCDLATTRMLSCATHHGSPVYIVAIWRCASRTTIYSSVSMVITFELRTWHIGLFRLSAMRYEYGIPMSASNASSNVVLRRRRTFSRDWFPRLVVRRRPSGSPLTASPVYFCIYSHFRPTPRWKVNTGLQLCFQSTIARNFPTNSIIIASQSINQFSSCLGLAFIFPASRHPRKTCFRPARFSLVPGRPMGSYGWLDPRFVLPASS